MQRRVCHDNNVLYNKTAAFCIIKSVYLLEFFFSILQPLVHLNWPLIIYYHSLKVNLIFNMWLQWETAIIQDLQLLHCVAIYYSNTFVFLPKIHIHFYNPTVAKVNLLYHPFTTITCGLTQQTQTRHSCHWLYRLCFTSSQCCNHMGYCRSKPMMFSPFLRGRSLVSPA